MSTLSRGSRRSHTKSSHSGGVAPELPYGQSLTPANDITFDACAATEHYFLYAQRNVILCLRHDTLAIERRFLRHKEDVQWITTDVVSERGSGRYAVSYDSSQTTIVWDIFTGEDVARFTSYEEIRVAAWMKDSNIAFGNSQGNVILFEPSTSEHISARTIFDPITALAPAADCRTFALGYMNGSILIATVQPAFTILHTLSTSRAPSPICKLAWHASSTKQKSDMLAVQTIDGDLRVWSVPKIPGAEQPSIIRVLSRTENDRVTGLCWFGWSKMGRIVQYSDGLTFVWDVRTKRVTYESVPTVDGLVGITSYGPTARLFTLGRNHTVQQYDLNPSSRPMLVQNVQHVPASLPPSPPISDGQQDKSGRYVTAAATLPAQQRVDRGPSGLPLYLDVETSESEGEVVARSPLKTLAKQEEFSETSEEEIEEGRDRLGPLSPVSSRASTTSRSSRGGVPKKTSIMRPSSRDEVREIGIRAASPGMVSISTHSGSAATTFSLGSASARSGYRQRAMRESISTRSLLSTSTNKSGKSSSRLRQEVLRSPQDTKNNMIVDLFPLTKARLTEVHFRPPLIDQAQCTVDDLRIKMLDTIFGWPDDIESMIREELRHQRSGSAAQIILMKWLGDSGADLAASMIGSESMTSSDWMLLALSSMGPQKGLGEAFVQRLLEKGDVHPAVSILLGLGEYNEAVEVYVSRKYFMEAVLLTCLMFPTEWQRQSHLVRKWGEVAVAQGRAELAVRCFSCTSMESSEPWFSPRAQDEVYAMQQRILAPDTPGSSESPVSSRGARLLPNQVGLKVVTSFNPAGGAAADPTTAIDDKTPLVPGITPIDAMFSPAGRRDRRTDPASALSTRTATPGGFGRKRVPSSSRAGSTRTQGTVTPSMDSARTEHPSTAIKTSRSDAGSMPSTRARSVSTSQASGSSYFSRSAFREAAREALPSPGQDLVDRLRHTSVSRNSHKDKNKEGLMLHLEDVIIDPSLPSSTIPTGASATDFSQSIASSAGASRGVVRTKESVELINSKIRSIDEYITGLHDIDFVPPSRTDNHSRATDKTSRPGSRTTHRAPSENRGRGHSKYIRPAKRSPSSPVSMSPDDPALQINRYDFANSAEDFYKLTSPTASAPVRAREKNKDRATKSRNSSRARSVDKPHRTRSRSHAEGAVEGDGRGRSAIRKESSAQRSPSSPRPMSPATSNLSRSKSKVGERVRERSMSRQRHEARRQASPEPVVAGPRRSSKPPMPRLQTNMSENSALARTKKQIAAQELEARRLSLVTKSSVVPIMHPDEIGSRSAIEPSVDFQAVFTMATDLEMTRGHTADPHALRKLASMQTSGSSIKPNPLGLPATPRAMRHPKDMEGEVPDVPQIPITFSGPTPPALAQESQMLTLLPAATYKPPSGPHLRSVSAPPEKFQGHQRRPSQGHSRKSSRDNSATDNITVVSPGADGRMYLSRNIDEAIRESQVIIIEQPESTVKEAHPPLLPELQHLAGPAPPPPPPPPPMMMPHQSPSPTEHAVPFMDEFVHASPPSASPLAEVPRVTSPFDNLITSPIESNRVTSPTHGHRRGRNSISESVGSRIRGISSRIRDRSASRTRPVISPPVQYTPAPYESLQQRRPSQTSIPKARTPMPYESLAMAASNMPQMQPSTEEPSSFLPTTTFGGYRNPKDIARQMREREEAAMAGASIDRHEGAATAPPRSSSRIRANMPPSYMQPGANAQI